VKRLVGAHVELGKAEVGEVVDEVKRVAVYAGIAIAVAIAAGLLLAVGLPLFLGEWIFGSIGWGILHGLLLLLGIGVTAVVLALGVGTAAVGRSVATAAVTGVVVGLALGLNLTNRGWGLAGDALLPLSDEGARPLAAALIVLPIVAAAFLGLLGLIRASREGEAGSVGVPARGVAALPTALFVGWLAAFVYAYSARVAWPDLSLIVVGVIGFIATLVVLAVIGGWRPGRGLVSGLSLGTVLGLILAVLTAIAFGGRVGAAIGVATGLAVWSGMMAVEIMQRGVDGEELKKRFVPQKTIDMTKETIEWVRARTPLSRRS
jgi:hypothetical protein